VSDALRTNSVFGEAIVPHLPQIAALRIAVFAEYPYLYQGSLENETRYLRGYAASPQCLAVLAWAGDAIVGVSTAMPAALHSDEVGPVLAAAGYDVSRVYYYGESVLDRAYRGRGLGHAFMEAREQAARVFGFTTAAFCAVVRPEDHAARPRDYVPHDAFWTKCGFVRKPDVVTHFEWQDLGENTRSAKPMVFWVKELT
jgi:GNAT superfamily N-acetyltransferase